MSKKGQVWIETVLYTLIGIVLIGVALAFISPRITDTRDRSVVEQAIGALNSFDEKVSYASETSDNVRIFDFTLKRGEIYVNASGDRISYVIRDLRKPYSELDKSYNEGRVKILSKMEQTKAAVYLEIDYTGRANITYDGSNNFEKKFNPVSIPYKFSIRNVGSDTLGAVPVIDIVEISSR